MTRFGGHPYDEMDLLPFNVVDPVKRTPLENLWGMGYNRNELVSLRACIRLLADKVLLWHQCLLAATALSFTL